MKQLFSFDILSRYLVIIFVMCPYFLDSQIKDEVFKDVLSYRNIGPANQGGRIVDIEADPNNFTKVFAATASGGIWKSMNAGTTWQPIFDHYETASMGDIALDPNNSDIIWAGTGEANNRNSVSWGNGIYKSEDGGKTFVHKGLSSTHQIARVMVNPKNSDDVCVCAIGHLWGYSGERGFFRSKDGGDTWKKITDGLPNDGKTGCTDLVIDPKNPNIMYTAFYHRLRQPWHFNSGGEKGGIYKSVDGGETWKKLSKGLPDTTGRIGLAIYAQNPDIMMAIIEAPITDTLDIPGSGIYRSEDGGESWNYVNLYNNRPFYYSQIRINPLNNQKVYVLTTRFMVSEDGGKTFINGSQDQEVHGDFHAMWLDPQNEDRYWLGADKGLSLTHDHGKNFMLIDNLPIAQFYRINYDMRDPYYVYGGLQDNGSYATASFSRDARGILNDANWKMHWGDGQDAAANPYDHTDMYTSMENGSFFKYNPETRDIYRISPNSSNTINHSDYFSDNADEHTIRFNWSAPLVMSPHHADHIYVAGNHVYKSIDKGKTWKIISPDLSTNHPEKRVQGKSGGITPDNTGAETHSAIYSLSISPTSENVIWAVTDDGNVAITHNGGVSWNQVKSNIKGVPAGIWASRVEASRYFPGRAYVSFDGHRSDDFSTYLYVTEDFGTSWKSITSGFPEGETVRVIREDHRNPQVLYAGTETGVFFTIDRGEHWSRLKLNMPTVSIYDLKIHPRDNDLIVGTHGRSIYILDDLTPIQEYRSILNSSLEILPSNPTTLWHNRSRGGQRGHFWFAGDNPEEIVNTTSIPRAGFDIYPVIEFYIGEEIQDSVTLEISNIENNQRIIKKVKPEQGFHKWQWNREFDAMDFTEAELIAIDKLLQEIVASIDNSRIRRAYARFQEAENSDVIRRILEPLSSGYLSFPIPEKFTIPRADAGTYKISMKSGKYSTMGTIIIKDDPMED